MEPFTTRHLNSENKLPLVIEPRNQAITLEGFYDLLREHNRTIKNYLLRYGGVLFRGFPVSNAEAFAAVVKQLQIGGFADYKGGDSPRIKIADGVSTSTEAPPWFRIPLHNELSYSTNFPSHILFYCDIAPLEKGETPIADAREVFHAIDPEIRDTFIEKGLSYSSSYHGGSGIIPKLVGKGHRSWQEVFETNDKKEVEKFCRERGMPFNWHENDWFSFRQDRPATHIHPETKEKVWFNQAHLFKLSPSLLGWWRYLATQVIYNKRHTLLHDVTYGDGSPIPAQTLEHILNKLEEKSIYFPWRKGDVLLLDNILAMHGRAPFKGKRRILTSMTAVK